jgi:hypothetical protein
VKLLLLAVTWAAGCAKRPPVEPAASAASGSAPSLWSDLLQSHVQLVEQPLEAQRGAAAELAAAVGDAGPSEPRMRLALLLTLGHPEVRDEREARALLQGAQWDDDGYKVLAGLIDALLLERAARAKDRVAAAEQLEAANALLLEAQARLEALKAIDRELDAR